MTKEFYWIIARLDGQPYLAYGGETREEAVKSALETLSSVRFEIVKYPTKDRNTASAYFRGKRLKETKDLREASRRIKHIVKRKVIRKRRR